MLYYKDKSITFQYTDTMNRKNTITPDGTIASALVYRFKADQIMVWWKENPNDAPLHDGMKKQIDPALAPDCERFYVLNPREAIKKQQWYSEYTYVFQPKAKTRLKTYQIKLLSKGFSQGRNPHDYLFKEKININGRERLFQAKFIKL